MLTRAELVRLEQDLRHKTVLSVYVNGEVSDNAARSQWRTELRNALDAIERTLVGATHAERENFASTRALALQKADAFTPGNAAPGWFGLFTPGEVHFAGIVPVSVPTFATWSLGTNVAPYIRVLKEAQPTLVVVADSTVARIYAYVDRGITLEATIEREARVDQPYHMSRPAPQGFSSGTRGRPGADAAQREERKATEVMLAAAAERIRQLAGDDAWVLIGGIDAVANELHGRLDKRFADRASVVSIDVHDNPARLAEVAREHASRLRSAVDLQRVEDVVAANAAGGTGAVGLRQIDKALELGQVRELFVTSDFVEKHPEEAEVAIRRAFEKGASVEHVSGAAADRLDEAGGVAAKLRFVFPPEPGSAATSPS